MNRRAFVIAGASALGVVAVGATPVQHAGPRLKSRPRKRTKLFAKGLQRLDLGDAERDGLVYVPASFSPDRPCPVIIALHGATQRARVMTTPLAPLAESLKCPVIAPNSRGITWDGIRDDFGVDVAFIDSALAWAFDRCNADPKRVWLAGFSDGASYGLALGLANGDLFTRVMAFSPGFIPTIDPSAVKPKIFISHGTSDPILPIDQSSRVLVPMLSKAGYDVRYDEFDGGHGMPAGAVSAAAHWLNDPGRTK